MITSKNILLTLSISFGILLFHACSTSFDKKIPKDSKALSEYLYSIKDNEDSLKIFLSQCERLSNHHCSMLTWNQLGKLQRNNARFSESLTSHQKALELALQHKDTINIVESLNSIGTVFRRIGALSEASNYHYQALEYAEAFSDLHTYEGTKNQVKSLNGIGNISLSLGHYEDALSYFQKALKGEIELDSPLGQAINLANIGSIYEHSEQYDSARIYYQESLIQNRYANSTMGIGLSHIHLGDLYRIEENYEKAKDEYEKAYILMENIADKWHWLEACLSIANIHLLTNNDVEFMNYLVAAESTATEINSPEHLATIYKLKHDYHLKKNDYQAALKNYKHSVALGDSIQGVTNSNQHMDIRVNYERRKYDRFIQEMEFKNAEKQAQRRITLYIFILISILALMLSIFLYYAYRQRTRVNKTLKELENIRTSFFTGITHEFRTPLTIMLGLAEQIKAKKDASSSAKTIIQQGNILLNMVNQLLDMTKIKSNIDNWKWVHDDIISYSSMGVETLREYASIKKIDLVFQSDDRVLKVDFLPDFIDKIIINLISNALKHTPKGGKISVIISSKKQDYHIQVIDTGSGIKPEDLPYIFDEFYQSEDQWQSGTGIGLAMVHKMVEIMKGSVEAKNRSGGGAEFIINLPKKQAFEVKEDKITNTRIQLKDEYFIDTKVEPIEQKEVEQVEEKAIEELSLPSILVVEDNADIQNYISSLLDDKYTIRFANNGQEGLEKAIEFQPDLIITDLTMPVMDGFQLCNAIRSNHNLNHIPIIVITAKSSDEDKQLALSLGANAFMVKPFSSRELKIRVENHLQQKENLRLKFSKMTVDNLKDTPLFNDQDRAFTEHLTTLIYQHITDIQLNGDMLAERMFMSRSQLNRRIKSASGLSLSAFITRVRLEKAKRMLSSNDTSIADIALACGFEDSNYFSRIFKQTYKQTPSQFRRSLEA